MSAETLYACPACQRSGFGAAGLRQHICQTLGGKRLTREDVVNIIAGLPPTTDLQHAISMSQNAASLTVVEAMPLTPAQEKAVTELGAEILSTQRRIKTHAQLAIAYATRLGLLCERAKEIIPHGGYVKWLESKGVSKDSSLRYRCLAENSAKLCLPAAELLSPGFVQRTETDEAYREQVAGKIKAAVGEVTLTDIYRELGLVRAAANTTTDADTGASKRVHYAAKKLSAEQIAKANRTAAQAGIKAALKTLENTLLKAKAYRHLTAPEIERHAQHLQDIATKFKTVAVRAAATALAAKKGAKS